MLEILSGSFRTGLDGKVAERILTLTKEKKKSLLIVPEQHSLTLEKEMSVFMPENAPLYFEVTNFTRLANSAFRALGGVANEHSDRTKRALVMWQALSELSPTLKVMKTKSGVKSGLVTKAIKAINDVESFGISAEELANGALISAKENPRLSDKLSDLSLVYSLYKKLLFEKYGDTGDELSILTEKLRQNPDYLSDTEIFIVGFSSFTEPQYRVIAELIERCRVSLILNITKSREDSFEFSEMMATRAKLVRLASRKKCEVKLTKYEGNSTCESEALVEMDSLLFSLSGTITAEIGEDLRVFEAKTPYEEASFIAEDIRRRVISGESFSDFAIVARELEPYLGTLDDALKKSGVPHFLSKPTDIFSREAVKHLLSALECVGTGFQRESVISYMKCGFSGASREACDEFELYAEKWQITGKRFSDGELFNMRPEGYTLRREADSDEKLIRINETKDTVLAPLIILKERLDGAKCVLDFARASYAFLCDTQTEELSRKRTAELTRLSEFEKAEENEALYGALIDSLDTLVSAVGDSEADLESFTARLEITLAETKLGRIPSYKDKVTIGSADTLRLNNPRHVYLIGARQGEFPKIPSDSSFFGDKEKLMLKNFGIEMDSSTEYELSRENFYFLRAFASAKRSVTVTYSATDFSFKATRAADPVLRLLKYGNLTAKKISALPLDERIFSLEGAKTFAKDSPALTGALTALGLEGEISLAKKKVLNDSLFISPEIAKLMYPGDLNLSQTRIDKFVDCPLAYFCQYELKLSENEKAEFDARNIGSFIHSILEKFFYTVKNLGIEAHELSAEEREKIAESSALDYLSELGGDMRSGREKFSLERLKKTAIPIIDELSDELSACSFKPSFFELSISGGKPGFPEASRFPLQDGTYARVFGSIDRVDSFKSGDDVYVRVIDYKTGAKDFSPSDIEEGRNLQMFLYLKAVIESTDKEFLAKVGVGDDGRIIPAGVIYIKTKLDDVKIAHSDEASEIDAFKKNQKREGMILSDEVSLSAMNNNFLPVSFKKDGSPTASSEKYLFREDEWSDILGKVEAAVIKVGNEMKSGSVSARPLKNKKTSPCTYCKFKPICRNAK